MATAFAQLERSRIHSSDLKDCILSGIIEASHLEFSDGESELIQRNRHPGTNAVIGFDFEHLSRGPFLSQKNRTESRQRSGRLAHDDIARAGVDRARFEVGSVPGRHPDRSASASEFQAGAWNIDCGS